MSAQTPTYRNVSEATFAGLAKLFTEGKVLNVRGHEIREIRNNILVLSRPLERCLFLPHRRNNVFTAIAETMWVLAGRNDIGWLKAYLPSVGQYSDDGSTWRAGYGPRLRNWQGVDQLKEVIELLLAEQATRRAAMSLYDPGCDFIDSKDIPCNNWLHWLIRDGKLHLNVALRSNDIIWGFSGINCFEWSVLQEMMAYWAGVEPGDATYFASSFHVYKRHYEKAEAILKGFRRVYCYDFDLLSPKFSTLYCDFDRAMRQWFEIEGEIRKSPDKPPAISNYFADPFFVATLSMVRLYHGANCGWTGNRIKDELATLPEDDFAACAYEHFGRKFSEVLQSIPQPRIAKFLATYANDAAPRTGNNSDSLRAEIKALHFKKNAAYGDSWKRRGEFISILANIARKVDRLDQYDRTGTILEDESILDTAIDLLVYVVKYQLFLLERLPHKSQEYLPPQHKTPFSNHVDNFNWRLDHMELATKTDGDLSAMIKEIFTEFERLNGLANDHGSTPSDRFVCALRLGNLAFTLVLALHR